MNGIPEPYLAIAQEEGAGKIGKTQQLPITLEAITLSLKTGYEKSYKNRKGHF